MLTDEEKTEGTGMTGRHQQKKRWGPKGDSPCRKASERKSKKGKWSSNKRMSCGRHERPRE